MTKKQINDLRYSVSPARFMREVVGFVPDPWQEKVLESNAKQIILNCTRQGGKSTVTSGAATHQARYFDNSLILLISPSLRQSSELFKKIQTFYKAIPNKLSLIEDNKLSMTLNNGSRIVSLPANEDTIRGFSAVDLMIIDEAAMVSDALYRTIRPMLAVSGGKLIIMSTPFGKRGFFHDEWHSTTSKWERYRVTADDCPRISQEFLESERASMGDWWFRQEYMCEFVENDNSVFNYDMIMESISDDVRPLFSLEPHEIVFDEVQPLFLGA